MSYISAKDSATSANVKLKTTLNGDEHTVHHNIDNVSGTVTVTGALTDTQLRASAVPVSGPLTDAELRASGIPVSFDAFPASGVDAFNRLRVSAPGYRFDSQFTYRVDTDLWDTKLTGTGSATHSSTERWVSLTAATTGDAAVLQSHYHAPYTPGRGQLVFITFLFGATPGTGAVRKAGYFDGSNGVYLQQDSTGLSLVLASDTTAGDEAVPQASWNVDTLGGGVLNPSGLSLDITKVQILVIQMQALYVGRVTVAFDIGGCIVPVHTFDCANESAYPYIQQASLPIRYEVATSSAAVTLRAICSSVISEGGNQLADMNGRPFSAFASNADVDAAEETVLAIRMKSTLNALASNVVAIPLSIDVTAETAGVQIEVRRNATLAGGSWTDVDAASAAEWSSDTVVTAGTGTLVDTFWVPASATQKQSSERNVFGKVVLAYSQLNATADNLTIVAKSGANSVVRAATKWKELR